VIATRKLIQDIERFNPDIVHLHNIHGYVLNYRHMFEYLNQKKIPVVWTFHDFWAITGHCAYFYQCEKWKFGCGECGKLRDYPRSITDCSRYNLHIKRELFSNSNLHLVAVSPWMKSYIKESILKEKPITVIPNGVDVQVFYNRNISKYQDIPDGEYIMLAVAIKWDNRKGLRDYIKLSSLLNDGEKIVLVGLTDKQIKQLPSNVIGLPRTETQDKLAELYSRADVVLSLSYAETFGLTIAESMACGTPVVAYDNTAQGDLLTEDTGVKVKTGDVDGVYKAIQEVKIKGKEFYSHACRTRAEEHFDKDKCFKKYIELYETLLNKSK
jgi:glycosyltransferase involved in cell wall biosynthesis